jgi:RimJ/RimL family protein N-acetyltransferase
MQLAVRLGDYLWRPLTASEEDTDFVLGLRNAPAAQAAFFSGQITRADHLRFFHLAEERGELNWVIEKGGERVGVSGIYRIDRKNRRAEGGRIAVTVPEVHLLNTVVSMYVVFEVLRFNKLCGEGLASNTASNRSLERVGFTREGLLREHVLKDEAPCDVYVYGMLAGDWLKIRPGIFSQFGEPKVLGHVAEDVW